MGENISQNIQAAQSTPTFQFRKASHPFCLLFILSIYLLIYLFTYYFYFHYNYYLLYLLLLLSLLLLLPLLLLSLSCYIFYFTYASEVRAACIIIPYNDGSRAPIWLSGRGRSYLAFTRSEMFGLRIAPKEKISHLFKPVSIQE